MICVKLAGDIGLMRETEDFWKSLLINVFSDRRHC